jgi:hypothetical protein
MILTPHLLDEFLMAMNDIGRYGEKKHGEQSFQVRRLKGDLSRGEGERCTPAQLALHANGHFAAYLRGERHDHFDSLRHQLAAVAFNAMMEFYFAGLAQERHEEALHEVRNSALLDVNP